MLDLFLGTQTWDGSASQIKFEKCLNFRKAVENLKRMHRVVLEICNLQLVKGLACCITISNLAKLTNEKTSQDSHNVVKLLVLCPQPDTPTHWSTTLLHRCMKQ